MFFMLFLAGILAVVIVCFVMTIVKDIIETNKKKQRKELKLNKNRYGNYK